MAREMSAAPFGKRRTPDHIGWNSGRTTALAEALWPSKKYNL